MVEPSGSAVGLFFFLLEGMNGNAGGVAQHLIRQECFSQEEKRKKNMEKEKYYKYDINIPHYTFLSASNPTFQLNQILKYTTAKIPSSTMTCTNANGSQEPPQASNILARQLTEDSQSMPLLQSTSPSHEQFFKFWMSFLTGFPGTRNLTKSALDEFGEHKKQMLQRYLNQGVKEEPAVIFARTQTKR